MKRRKISFALLLFLLNTLLSLAENNDPVFENISIEKGLSSRTVYCIAEDINGFLWFGTEDGLNKYDGYNFKNFRHHPNDSLSISNSKINCLFRTRDKVLWVGTDKGLNKYNPVKETFGIVRPSNDARRELGNQRIRTLYEDKKQNLWIGTQSGLFRYDRKRNAIRHFVFQNSQRNVSLNIIRCIYEDSEGMLWVGTFDGLFRFNPSSKKYRHYKIRKETLRELPNNLILSINEFDHDQRFLWVGTESGLCKFNKVTGEFETYHAENKKSGLSNSTIKQIFAYKPGCLLLGTDEGLNLFDSRTKTSKAFLHDNFNNLSVADNVIWSIFKDREGVMWIGTNNGISKMNPKRKCFNINNINDSKNEIILNDIADDSKGNIWVGSFDGILRVNQNTKQTKKYLFESESKGTNKFCKKILIDRKGKIWAGTNNGLFYYDQVSDKFRKIDIVDSPLLLKYIFDMTEDESGNIWTNVNNGICQIIPVWSGKGTLQSFSYRVVSINKNILHNQNNEISCIHSDHRRHIWFGVSNEGLCKYDMVSGVIARFKYDGGERPKINSDRITNIFSDNKNTLYVMTDQGLCRYDEKSGQFDEIDLGYYHQYSLNNGIADKNNNLWLSSFLNLFQYNIHTGKIISYDFNYELKNKGFVTNSIYKNASGTIYLGSYDRYVSFQPENITVDVNAGSLFITSVKALDKEISWKRRSREENGEKEEVIDLNHDQNFIKIYFSLLDYDSPVNNKYSYILENVDKSWITTSGVQNYATYSNLLPGNYIFKLRGANPDGYWSKDVVLMKIHINPPWWKSWQAYVAYLFLFLLLFYFIIRMVYTKIELSRALKLEKQEHERTEEINQIKLRFFTNISHEFRTTLTLILGPIENLMEQIGDPKYQEQLMIMKSNGERLLRLINQILDFRKIENKKMELNPATGEMVSFVKSIYVLFSGYASKQNIEYIFDASCTQCIMSFDKDKMEKVIYNLLSNAFKFTSNNGCIILSMDRKLKQDEECMEISVSDNGTGIPEEEHALIFERFYQSRMKSADHTDGTGIGLTLCKEFVELHHGNISLKSKVGVGSTFVVSLPVDEGPNQPVEITETENRAVKENARVLIVEDNAEMRQFLRKSLEDLYEIHEASNGKEGLEIVQRSIPDVIVSDLMMPVMNGLEFCEKIKSSMLTSHIPFVLLTARVNEEAACEGFSFGADDYITKPFSLKLLKIRIAKLIEQKQKMHEYFRLKVFSEPKNIVAESPNEKFIHLLVEAIDENLDNPDLNIEQLCQKLNVTHQQLYRKIKALTGQTASEFIRSVRLKKASQLLRDSDMNISEIMYRVGFSNRSYFSKCFMEQYEVTPKVYRETSAPC